MNRLPFALAFIAVFLSSPAHADDLQATLDQPLREVSHAVDIHLRDGVAVYKVKRSFANSGTLHEEASLRIHLPFGAAATGLRIRARDRWYEGDLMEAEEAAQLYQELTGRGPHVPRDPALLQWVWADRLHLQVFPVIPKSTSTVEYTLTVPTIYNDGRYVLFYPRHNPEEGDLVAPIVRVFPDDPGAFIVVDGQPLASEQPTVLAAPDESMCASILDDLNASCVVSSVAMEHDVAVAQAQVHVDISHTYRSDLEVRLIAPNEAVYPLHQRDGSDENNLKTKYTVRLSEGTRSKGTWKLLVSDHAALDVGVVNEWKLEMKGAEDGVSAKDLPIFVPDSPEEGGEGHSIIEISSKPIRDVAARLGRVDAAAQTKIIRLELDTAPMLRPMPKKLSVVFVVDASWSVSEEMLTAQLDVARAFIKHVPDAHAEVVLFRRRAERLWGRFVPTPNVENALRKAHKEQRMVRGNGSALDAGLQLAEKLLADRQGPKTIVFSTDTLLRSTWHNREGLKTLKGTRATVHGALPVTSSSSSVNGVRNDEHDLASIALSHGGVLLEISGLPSKSLKPLEPIALGLVRPVRIDHVKIVGVGADALDYPDTLEEGTGLRLMETFEKAPRMVEIQGDIWATPFRKRVYVSQDFSRTTAAFTFSHDMHDALTEKEQLKVAFFGRAVSPVTSYLAIEPGVRPSTIGLEDRGGGRGMLASRMALGVHVLGASPQRPNLNALLQNGIAECKKAHPTPTDWSQTITVETTLDEVVDVRVSKPHPATRCVVEKVWEVRLTSDFVRTYDTYTLFL